VRVDGWRFVVKGRIVVVDVFLLDLGRVGHVYIYAVVDGFFQSGRCRLCDGGESILSNWRVVVGLEEFRRKEGWIHSEDGIVRWEGRKEGGRPKARGLTLQW
jgi:hypothetical protein